MNNLTPEQRAVFGQHANTVKKELEEVIENKRKALADAKMREMFEKEAVDVTAPGKVCCPRGRIPYDGVQRNSRCYDRLRLHHTSLRLNMRTIALS